MKLDYSFMYAVVLPGDIRARKDALRLREEGKVTSSLEAALDTVRERIEEGQERASYALIAVYQDVSIKFGSQEEAKRFRDEFFTSCPLFITRPRVRQRGVFDRSLIQLGYSDHLDAKTLRDVLFFKDAEKAGVGSSIEAQIPGVRCDGTYDNDFDPYKDFVSALESGSGDGGEGIVLDAAIAQEGLCASFPKREQEDDDDLKELFDADFDRLLVCRYDALPSEVGIARKTCSEYGSLVQAFNEMHCGGAPKREWAKQAGRYERALALLEGWRERFGLTFDEAVSRESLRKIYDGVVLGLNPESIFGYLPLSREGVGHRDKSGRKVQRDGFGDAGGVEDEFGNLLEP